MDVTILKHENKFCGVYLDNGILLDAREGVGTALKENGIQPRTVFLTATSGSPVSGLSELEGVPIGYAAVDKDCDITQFQVGSKGHRKYGYRIKTPDGELVYAPEFERLEKSKIAGANIAILDPGDRTEVGDAAGLSHKSFGARERMVANAGVGKVLWTDSEYAPLSMLKESYADKPKQDECPEDDPDCKDMMSEKSVDLDEQISAIGMAFRDYDFGLPVDKYSSYIVKNYDDAIIVCFYGEGHKYYRIGYTKSGDTFTFEQPSAWQVVEMTHAYTPVEKSGFFVQKEEQGEKYKYWTSVSSSSFEDQDGEIVSETAMDFAIAVAKHRGDAGNLVWDHYDELPLGPCTSQTRVGRFLVEQGEFYDTPLAQKAAAVMKSAEPGKYRVSIGFDYWKGTKSKDGTYHLIDIYHRAVTDHPANAVTGIEVTKSMSTKKLNDSVLADVQKALKLTDEEMKEIVANVPTLKLKEASADTQSVEKKTEEKPAETPAPETKVDATVKVEMPAEYMAELTSLKATIEALKADKEAAIKEVRDSVLTILKAVPAGEITRPSQTTANEVTPAEKEKAAELLTTKEEKSATGFGAIYQMFQSTAKV